MLNERFSENRPRRNKGGELKSDDDEHCGWTQPEKLCTVWFCSSGLQYPGSKLWVVAFPAVLHLCSALRGTTLLCLDLEFLKKKKNTNHVKVWWTVTNASLCLCSWSEVISVSPPSTPADTVAGSWLGSITCPKESWSPTASRTGTYASVLQDVEEEVDV